MGRKSRGKAERSNELQERGAQRQPTAFQGSLFQATYRSGPMPDSAELREYEAIVPGIAQSLLDLNIAQSQHRQKLEARVVNHGIAKSYIGQGSALAIALLTVWRSTEALLQGQDVAGIVGVLIALGSLLAVFLVGKGEQKKELDKRSPQ